MKTYLLKVPAHYFHYYEIQAENEETALEIYYNGKAGSLRDRYFAGETEDLETIEIEEQE